MSKKLSLLMAAASLMGSPQEHYALPGSPMRMPVAQVKRHKGESPKCKTCIYFGCAHCCQDPMGMACEDYKRKKKKR